MRKARHTLRRKVAFAVSALAGTALTVLWEQYQPKTREKLVLRHLNKEVKESLVAPDVSVYSGLHKEYYREIRLADVLSLVLDKENAMIVMTDSRWMNCQRALPVLDKALTESDTHIYYVDTAKKSNQDETVIQMLEMRLAAFVNADHTLHVPTVLVLKEGSVASAEVGIYGLKGQPLDLETEEGANELFSIYCHMIMEYRK